MHSEAYSYHRQQRTQDLLEVQDKMSPFQGKEYVVATHKAGVKQAIALAADIKQNRITGRDPEYLSFDTQERVEEPLSSEPVKPTIWKLLRMVEYLKNLQRVLLVDHHINHLNREFAAQHMPSILALQHAAVLLMATYAEEEVERLVNSFTIMASDVVMLIDDEPVHREVRDAQQEKTAVTDVDGKSELEIRLRQRHETERKVTWHFAFGIWEKGEMKLCEFIIETMLPALTNSRADLIKKYLAPQVSGGLRLVEMMSELPEQAFFIRDVAGINQAQISRQKAEWIIVNKSLPTEAFVDLVTNDTYTKTFKGEELHRSEEEISVEMVPLLIGAMADVRQPVAA